MLATISSGEATMSVVARAHSVALAAQPAAHSIASLPLHWVQHTGPMPVLPGWQAG